MIQESDKFQKEIEALKLQVSAQDKVKSNVEALEAQIEALKKSENDMQAENTRTSVEFEKKKKEAEQARSLKVECDLLREQVQEL